MKRFRLSREQLLYWLFASTALCASFGLAGCGLQRNGLIVLVDDDCRARVIASSRDGFASPDAVHWDGHRLLIADEGSHGIAVRSTDRAFHQLVGPQQGVQSPEDLVIDAEGNIYFTDDDAGGVWRLSSDGKLSVLASKDDGLQSTEGIALADNGHLLVGDGVAHAIFDIAPDGRVSVFLGPEAGIRKPESLVFDGQGNLYIADNVLNVVFRLDKSGELRKLITARDGLTQPESLCYQGDALYITDDEAGKLYRYTPSEGLKTLAVFAGQLKNLQGISAGPEGSLLLTVQDLRHHQGLIIQFWRSPETSMATDAIPPRTVPMRGDGSGAVEAELSKLRTHGDRFRLNRSDRTVYQVKFEQF